MARATFVKKARKDVPGTDIKAGDSYFWWKFKRGGKHFSKTAPRRSQLTQSEFYANVYDLQDEIGELSADADLPDRVEDFVSRLNEIADECEEKVQNMPEGLQQGSVAELLNERADAMRNAASEFEALDLSEWDEEFDEPEREEDETDEAFAARVEEAKREAEAAHWQEKLEEVQGIDVDAP